MEQRRQLFLLVFIWTPTSFSMLENIVSPVIVSKMLAWQGYRFVWIFEWVVALISTWQRRECYIRTLITGFIDVLTSIWLSNILFHTSTYPRQPGYYRVLISIKILKKHYLICSYILMANRKLIWQRKIKNGPIWVMAK